jgi:hypothetical protein
LPQQFFTRCVFKLLDLFTQACSALFFFFFFFCSSGVWTWGLTLDRQVIYYLSHSPSPFCFSSFSNRVSHLCLVLGHYLPIYPSYIAGMMVCATTLSFLLVEMGVLLTFSLKWSQATILPISASWATRTIVVSHCAQILCFFLFLNMVLPFHLQARPFKCLLRWELPLLWYVSRTFLLRILP